MNGQASESFVRRVLDNLIAFVAVLAPDGTLLEVNQAPLDLAELKSSDVVGKKFWDCFWWSYSTEVQDRLHDVVERAARGDTSRYDLQGLIAGGALLWIDFQLAPMRDNDGVITHLIASAVDISDRKQIEQALHQADHRKDQFLATLAHELRAPLAPIRTAARVLEERDVDDEMVRASQRIISRQADHMARLLDDLLDVSRIRHGALELRREQCDLADLIAAAVETARPLIDGKGHRLDVALPAAPVRLEVDATRMTQVVANLLANAAKYTDRNGHIQVRAELDDDGLIILVRDDGIGIEDAARPGLFAMFFQVSRACDRGEGLGVGLSLVRGVVESHGGSVDVHSDGPGKGSTFTVRLPASCLCTHQPQPARCG